MRETRTVATAAVGLALASCAWRPSTADDCSRIRASGGNVAVERLAAGHSSILLTHLVCSSRGEALDRFDAHARSLQLAAERGVAEVGRCSRVAMAIEPTAQRAQASAALICEAARGSGATYVMWTAAVGDQFLATSSRSWSIRPLHPPSAH